MNGRYGTRQTFECVKQCPSRYYESDGSCTPCSRQCSSCINSRYNDCTSCESGFYRLEKRYSSGKTFECVHQCPPNYYKSDMSCIPCYLSCSSCVSNSSNGCTSCASGYSRMKERYGTQQTFECVEKCPSRSYASRGRCTPCDISCNTCIDRDTDRCTSCSRGYYELKEGYGRRNTFKCVEECPSRYYESDGSCIICHHSCNTCNGTDRADCTSCYRGRTLRIAYPYNKGKGTCEYYMFTTVVAPSYRYYGASRNRYPTTDRYHQYETHLYNSTFKMESWLNKKMTIPQVALIIGVVLLSFLFIEFVIYIVIKIKAWRKGRQQEASRLLQNTTSEQENKPLEVSNPVQNI